MRHETDDELPQQLLDVLPSDPHEQLDLARKITNLAVTSRVSRLEADAVQLRQMLAEKEHIIHGLQERVREAEQALQEKAARLSLALEEQEKMTLEKNIMVASVKKLNQDVAKLATFKRTLMQSLQGQEDISYQREGDERVPVQEISAVNSPLSSNSSLRDIDFSSIKAKSLEDDKSAVLGSAEGSSPDSFSAQEEKPEADGMHVKSWSIFRSSKNGSLRDFPLTPHLPPQVAPTASPKWQSTADSPSQQSAEGSPGQYSAPGSPKQLSSVDSKVSMPSSHLASHYATAPNSPIHAARTPRVDGKDFFLRTRNRLSYEQFSAFLANIKELIAHRQTREETLSKSDKIFGPDNKDLYMAFEGLLNRHLSGQGFLKAPAKANYGSDFL